MAIMRIGKNNNFSIGLTLSLGTKCPRKWGQNVPESGDKMSPEKLKGVGQKVECKSDTVRKK